jgi:hypothetical protein
VVHGGPNASSHRLGQSSTVDPSRRRQLENEALQLAVLMNRQRLDEQVDGIAITRKAGLEPPSVAEGHDAEVE